MKLIAAVAIAMAIAAPAQANPFAEVCKNLSRVAYQGAVEGQQIAPIMDGIAVQIYAANSSSAEINRVITSAYLAGYALGLLDGDPAEVAVEYYNGCISEPV